MGEPTPLWSRHLALGPISGPPGGATALFYELGSTVPSDPECAVRICLSSTGAGLGRAGLSRLINVLLTLWAHRTKVGSASLHLSGGRGLLVAAVVGVSTRAIGLPLTVRFFGGGLDYSISGAKGLIFRWALRRQTRILVETRYLVAFLENQGFVNVDWFPNHRAITTDNLRRPTPSGNRNRVVVYAGRLDRSKGLVELAKAVEEIDGYTLYVAGPEGDIFKRDLREFHKTTYLGVLSREEVHSLYLSAYVTVLPTKYWGEGYPGAIIESLQAGCPVIATDWRALKEIVQHGHNGLLIREQSVNDIRSALLDMSDSTLRDSLASNCKESVEYLDSRLWVTEFRRMVRSCP